MVSDLTRVARANAHDNGKDYQVTMCRAQADGGRRCPGKGGEYRRAQARRRYHERKARNEFAARFNQPPGGVTPDPVPIAGTEASARPDGLPVTETGRIDVRALTGVDVAAMTDTQRAEHAKTLRRAVGPLREQVAGSNAALIHRDLVASGVKALSARAAREQLTFAVRKRQAAQESGFQLDKRQEGEESARKDYLEKSGVTEEMMAAERAYVNDLVDLGTVIDQLTAVETGVGADGKGESVAAVTRKDYINSAPPEKWDEWIERAVAPARDKEYLSHALKMHVSRMHEGANLPEEFKECTYFNMPYTGKKRPSNATLNKYWSSLHDIMRGDWEVQNATRDGDDGAALRDWFTENGQMGGDMSFVEAGARSGDLREAIDKAGQFYPSSMLEATRGGHSVRVQRHSGRENVKTVPKVETVSIDDVEGEFSTLVEGDITNAIEHYKRNGHVGFYTSRPFSSYQSFGFFQDDSEDDTHDSLGDMIDDWADLSRTDPKKVMSDYTEENWQAAQAVAESRNERHPSTPIAAKKITTPDGEKIAFVRLFDRYNPPKGRGRKPLRNIKIATGEREHVVNISATSPATDVHELAHVVEANNPHVVSACKRFLEDRTLDKTLSSPSFSPGSRNEKYCFDAGFAEEYSSRNYEGQNHTEVFSTGMEAIFMGKYGALQGKETGRSKTYAADPEHRALILGLLAESAQVEVGADV